ncbi:R3H domain-containing protein/SUZ domain-containing protein, partial [Cephalotus follicularis]
EQAYYRTLKDSILKRILTSSSSLLPQFLVEELAYLVKDNLQCKHLVLSMEEAFINFLQDDHTISQGVLELEPMSSYNRLLLHRLADIFGFAHESVGEGEDRHLVLERCPETSIPSILVSDIVYQYDKPLSPMESHRLLRRKDSPPALKTKLPSLGQHTFEERDAAYRAARERIFSIDVVEIRDSSKQKPKHIPVVARRMIAHALGKNINPSSHDVTVRDSEEHEGKTEKLNLQYKDSVDPKVHEETIFPPCQNINLFGSNHSSNVSQEPAESRCPNVSESGSGRSKNGSNNDLKKENLGAAKRLFAHALGLHTSKDGFLSKCKQTVKDGSRG